MFKVELSQALTNNLEAALQAMCRDPRNNLDDWYKVRSEFIQIISEAAKELPEKKD